MIMEYTSEPYMVSIRLMCFKHAAFIRQAMDGIMMQQTNFKVEVVVGDDFSKDGTLDIIKTYRSTDNIEIKILERPEGGAYAKQRQALGRGYNFINILENCSAKYVALLDGDDYWTDPQKLQKQVDLLGQNKDCILCFTNASVLNSIQNTRKERMVTEIANGTRITLQEYLTKGVTIPTLTAVYRRDCFPQPAPDWLPGVFKIDWFLFLSVLRKGNGIFLDECTAVYRIHGGGLLQTDKTRLWENGVFEAQMVAEYFKPLHYDLLTDNVSWHMEQLAYAWLRKGMYIKYVSTVWRSYLTGKRKNLEWIMATLKYSGYILIKEKR